MIDTNQNHTPTVTFVDLFAGIGGFHIGITQAAKKSGLSAYCELAVDINPKARATYSEYFKDTRILNDVTDQSVKDSVPKNVDIICGGFPCQPFSLAGKKLGQKDARGTLFMDIVDILKAKRPKAVFLENVRNLLNIKNDDDSKTIDIIIEELGKAGYCANIHPFRASQFGLPTHRPRIYIVGFRDDLGIEALDEDWWPKPISPNAVGLNEYFKNLGEEWSNLDIVREGWPLSVGRTLRVGGVGSAFKSLNWLNHHPSTDYINVGDGRIWVKDPRTWDSYLLFENEDLKTLAHVISVDEAKAMMGFPHDFKFPEEKIVSKSQRMKQLGNSVAIPVIEAIASRIIETIYLDKNGSNKP